MEHSDDQQKPSSSNGRNMSRSYSDTFPRQKAPLPSPNSTAAVDGKNMAVNLNKLLSATTRFAFTDLLITILRLDFYSKSDEHSIIFCKKALEVILKWGMLPQKTQNTLRLHLEEEQPFNEDISALITTIKSDAILAEHGFTPLLGSFLLTILLDGNYDSRFRVLLRHSSALLGVHWDVFEEFESTLGDQLMDEFKESLENQQIREKKQKMRKIKRYAIIGAATGLGGVLIGVTGGLAAPLIVSSVSALTTITFAGLTATATAAIFGSLFGVAGAGLSGYRMKKRVGEIEEFLIERMTEEENRALHCVLCVSGWIEDRETQAFRHHWRHLWMSKEQYTLRWESKYLEELGKGIEYFVSFVVSYAIQRSLMETVLAGLVSAIAWPLILMGSASILDNPWNILTQRAVEAGEHLAEALLTRAHGSRPITLIGFSLGARVIYHCLLEMSKRKPDSLGIIEDVILLGAPVSASPSQWRQICSVVAGRVINGYCKTDWLLRFLYRTMSVQFIIAGTGPVENKDERKILNFNLSHIVKGHLDYAKKLTRVLEAVGVRVTPLSLESKKDLKKLEEEQIDEKSNKKGPVKCDEMDLPSTIVERMKELPISRAVDEQKQQNDENTDEEDDEDCITLSLSKPEQDPLKAIEPTTPMRRRADSLVSGTETFHSAISTFNNVNNNEEDDEEYEEEGEEVKED